MATDTKVPVGAAKGGSFLVEDRLPRGLHPRGLQRRAAHDRARPRTTSWRRRWSRGCRRSCPEVRGHPRAAAKAGELGLLGVEVPEEYGGLGLDKVSGCLVSEKSARDGSFAVSFMGHTGIGTLPIVYFGTEAQKKKYLPKLASGEWISSYSLSEASSASDAMNAKARAVLSPDGNELDPERREDVAHQRGLRRRLHHLRQGRRRTLHRLHHREGHARRVAGRRGEEDRHQGQLHPAAHPAGRADPPGEPAGGDRQGPQDRLQHPEHRPLQARGGGHRAAPSSRSRARSSTAGAGTAFGSPITSFGLVREKIAQMALLAYVSEAVVYRTAGMIDRNLEGAALDDPAEALKRIEAYDVECSMVKVWCSEMLDYVVDETVQIHGGAGYVEDYPGRALLAGRAREPHLRRHERDQPPAGAGAAAAPGHEGRAARVRQGHGPDGRVHRGPRRPRPRRVSWLAKRGWSRERRRWR